jgi:hypothetical protein
VTSSSDYDKEQISDYDKEQFSSDYGKEQRLRQEGGGGTPCGVHGTIGGTPCRVHGTTLGLEGTPCAKSAAAVKEASDRLDEALALEVGSEAGEDIAVSLAPVPGLETKKVQWCDSDDEGLGELVVPATTTTTSVKKKQSKNKNKAARNRRWQGEERDVAMLELAVELADSLGAGKLEFDDVNEAVRTEAEVRRTEAEADGGRGVGRRTEKRPGPWLDGGRGESRGRSRGAAAEAVTGARSFEPLGNEAAFQSPLWARRQLPVPGHEVFGS